jgi:hypothetical protein
VDSNGDLILPMTNENLESFLGYMSADREDGSCKAITTFTGYCTALKHFYKEKKVPIDVDNAEYFKQFQSGYKRIIAEKKQDGFMKNHEGKVPISYLVYCKLAKLALFICTNRFCCAE